MSNDFTLLVRRQRDWPDKRRSRNLRVAVPIPEEFSLGFARKIQELFGQSTRTEADEKPFQAADEHG